MTKKYCDIYSVLYSIITKRKNKNQTVLNLYRQITTSAQCIKYYYLTNAKTVNFLNSYFTKYFNFLTQQIVFTRCIDTNTRT